MQSDELSGLESNTKQGKKTVPISVVIPMYNAELTIEEALRSINRQTVIPQEVVIIDDGSSDGSVKIINNYIEKGLLDFQCILVSQKNAGPSSARNKAILKANKPLIAFLDADDEWLNDKIEKQYTLFITLLNNNNNVGIVDCYQMDKYLDVGIDSLINRVKSGMHFTDFYHMNAVNGTSCVLVEKELLLKYGGFDESLRFSEDRWLWSNICYEREIHTVPELLCIRYIGETNIVRNPGKYFKYKKEFVVKFIEKYKAEMKQDDQMNFLFSSYYDFYRLFYSRGDYNEADSIFREMFAFNWKIVFYKKGIVSLKYIHIFFTLLLKRK